MKVMISGGTGLIGRALAQGLLSRGHEAWVLTRSPQRGVLPEQVRPVGWDAGASQGWVEQLEEMDVLVNLAGENLGAGRWTPERKRRILNSRVAAGKAIEAAFRQARRKPPVLVQFSAVGYYGSHCGNQVLSAESPPGDDFLAEVCTAWEDSTRLVETIGVRRVITRSGLVLTRKGGVMERILLPFRLFAGGPLGGGRQWWPWIHIQDVVAGLIFLMEQERARGAFNLTAPQPVRMAEFGRTLARVIQRPYWLPVPEFALRLLLGEMSTLVMSSQRAIPLELEALGYPFRFATLRPALEDLFGSGAQLNAAAKHAD